MSKTYYLIRYLFGLGGAGFNDALRLFVPHAQGEREKNDGDSPAGAGSYNVFAQVYRAWVHPPTIYIAQGMRVN